MSSIYRQLAPVAFAAGGNSGAVLKFDQVPANLDGGALYIRSIQFGFVGVVTSTAGGNGNLSRLIAQMLMQIPGVCDPLNISGNGSARLFRIENGGEFPPFVAPATNIAWTGVANLAAGANAVSLTWVHDLARPGSRRYDDGAIPVALLQKATFKVTFGALTDVIADNTATTGTLTVTLELCRKAELRAPQLSVVDELDVTGTQPPISPVDGKVVTHLVRPTSQGVFANATDYANIGLGYGDYKLTEDNTPIGVFYSNFNRIATTDLQQHTAAQTDRTASIPLVFPPGGRQGQHITFESMPPGSTPRVKVDAAAVAYTHTRRYVLDNRSPAMRECRRLLGIPEGGYKALTASHKPTMSAEVEAFVPLKATARR